MKKEEFEITSEKTSEGVKFMLKGFISSVYADVLQGKLEESIKAGEHNIILNMTRVEYLCSTGIRVLLKIYKDANEAGGKLSIEKPSERVRNVLGMVALNEMLLK